MSNLEIDIVETWSQILDKAKRAFNHDHSKFHDWTGIFWGPDEFPIVPHPTEAKFELPLNGDGFRAGRVEWEAFGIAYHLAKSENLGKFVAIELGASAAPWMLTFVKHLPENLNMHTVAVEAGKVNNLTKNFWSNNGIEYQYKRKLHGFHFSGAHFQAEFIRALATSEDGWAWFPKVDISKDNGAKGDKSLASLDRRGGRRASLIRRVNVGRLMKRYSNINFLHMDVQGAEEEIIQDIEFINQLNKVEVMLIGTHSTSADSIAEALTKRSCMTLLASTPMKPGGPNGEWPVDGEFLFVNRSVISKLRNDSILIGQIPGF